MIVDLPEAMMSSDEQTMTPRQRDEHTASVKTTSISASRCGDPRRDRLIREEGRGRDRAAVLSPTPLPPDD
jgi:hypothetical protein